MKLGDFAKALALVLAIGVPTAMGGCGGDDDGDGDNNGGTANGGGSGGGSAADSSTAGTGATGVGGGFNPNGESTCQGKVYQCGDTLDNDGDGLADSADPDCLGPCDNTETSYFGGIPGQANAPCKQDCYFDQDTGAGNDACYWTHECDPKSVAPDYPPEGSGCKYNENANTPGTDQSCSELYETQLPLCGTYCGPLTPNGCDCFGCCELPAGGGNYVWLGSSDDGGQTGTCTREGVSDPSKCKPCTPVKACLNGCGKCEICLGKETVPPECTPDAGIDAGYDGGVELQCPVGVQACGLAGQAPCPANYYCITGCCYAVPT